MLMTTLAFGNNKKKIKICRDLVINHIRLSFGELEDLRMPCVKSLLRLIKQFSPC